MSFTLAQMNRMMSCRDYLWLFFTHRWWRCCRQRRASYCAHIWVRSPAFPPAQRGSSDPQMRCNWSTDLPLQRPNNILKPKWECTNKNSCICICHICIWPSFTSNCNLKHVHVLQWHPQPLEDIAACYSNLENRRVVGGLYSCSKKQLLGQTCFTIQYSIIFQFVFFGTGMAL